jgi:hypothetical protein
MAKDLKKKNVINAAIAGGANFRGTAQEHIMLGSNPNGNGAHTGLHSLNTAAGHYPNLTEIRRIDTDARVPGIYSAEIRLTANNDKGTKISTFFPATMNWAAVRAAIVEAWEDGQINRTNDIYVSMRNKYTLGMAGMATIGGQKIWVGSMQTGSAASQIGTAFPAVNNKFI